MPTSTKKRRRADNNSIPLDTDKIKARREFLGLSMEQAAKLAALNGGRQRWNDIESGRHANLSIKTLEAVAGALGWKAKDILKD